MKQADLAALAAEMEQLPEYRNWWFTFEFPGLFRYSHRDNNYSVFFTPDWDEDAMLPIQVQVNDGDICDAYSAQLPLPHEGRSAQQIFDLVRPTLDQLLLAPQQVAPRTIDLRISLTAEEVTALQDAREHVRVHMAHEHSWATRDAALAAIGKVLAAAREETL